MTKTLEKKSLCEFLSLFITQVSFEIAICQRVRELSESFTKYK